MLKWSKCHCRIIKIAKTISQEETKIKWTQWLSNRRTSRRNYSLPSSPNLSLKFTICALSAWILVTSQDDAPFATHYSAFNASLIGPLNPRCVHSAQGQYHWEKTAAVRKMCLWLKSPLKVVLSKNVIKKTLRSITMICFFILSIHVFLIPINANKSKVIPRPFRFSVLPMHVKLKGSRKKILWSMIASSRFWNRKMKKFKNRSQGHLSRRRLKRMAPDRLIPQWLLKMKWNCSLGFRILSILILESSPNSAPGFVRSPQIHM